VPFKLVKVRKGEYPYWENQFWAEPSIAEAGRYMKKLVSNKIFSNKISRLGQLTIKKNHSAKQVSLIINDHLKFYI
jgi:hypothetical protein